MHSAGYYRMLADECFRLANEAVDKDRIKLLRSRGQEYSEMAAAIDRGEKVDDPLRPNE